MTIEDPTTTSRWLRLPEPSRRAAIAIGVMVTFLWASSVVFIRLGVSDEDVQPIGFAGVRFMLAGLLLLPLAVPSMRAVRSWQGGRRWLGDVAIYGLILFCLAQIGFYLSVGDVAIPTVGLLMGLAPVVTAVVALRSEHERPGLVQAAGIGVLVVGVALYFGLEKATAEPTVAFLFALSIPISVGVGAYVGRGVAVESRHFGGPAAMTSLAMIVGSAAMLAVAVLLEGIPTFSPTVWALILWMAAVNTALTYTLWAQTQRTLRAVEASVLGDLTVVLVAVLGWVVFDERISAIEAAGIALTLAGVVLVQVAPFLRRRADPSPVREDAV